VDLVVIGAGGPDGRRLRIHSARANVILQGEKEKTRREQFEEKKGTGKNKPKNKA
jgi:hypothetical protein